MGKEKVRSWKKRPSRELSLCFCGYADCESGYDFGPAVRPNYVLHYILSGKGEFQVDGCLYALGQGQGFLIEPNVMTQYHADRQDPWTYLWIGFEGTQAAALLENAGLNTRIPVFAADCGGELLTLVQQLLTYEEDRPEQMLLILSDMYRFFSCIARSLSQQQKEAQWLLQNGYVSAAVEYIRRHYAEDIKVQDIAAYAGISRAYLTLLFKKFHQTSPNEYLTSFRLTRAREQLAITDLPIGMISSLCGYHDPLVFSKVFKLRYHMTPTQYRRTIRAEQHMRLCGSSQADRHPLLP